MAESIFDQTYGPNKNRETWNVEYDMQTPRGVVHVKEALPCRQGYHQKLIEWYKQNGFDSSKVNPLYKVRGNHIEMLSLDFGGSGNLPLEKSPDLKEGALLFSDEHPIILEAPDKTRYVCVD